MKKTFFNSVVMVAAIGLGLVAGYILRAKFQTGSNTASLAANDPNSKAGETNSAAAKHTNKSKDDSPLTTKLEHDLSLCSGVKWWLCWTEALEKADAKDFPRLVALAANNPAALRLVGERWMAINPRQMFDAIAAAFRTGQNKAYSELASILFREWPRRDPAGAIAALNGSSEFGPGSGWRAGVAATIVEIDPELGLRTMAEWHIGGFEPFMTSVRKWAAADPRHAADFTMANPTGRASTSAMEVIGAEWAKTDARAALQFAMSNPGELGSVLANTALKEWAAHDLSDAASWLSDVDAHTRNHLSPAFVEVWAKQDAANALAWCEQNLQGSTLAEAVGGVLKGAAEKNVATAADLVATMQESPAKAEAAIAVAQKWFPGFSSGQPMKPEAITWLNGLDSETINRVLSETTWQWATTDPKSMASFLAGRSAEEIPEFSCEIVARELARKSPLEAIEWAAQLPEGRNLDAGGTAFAEWRRAQPEAATKWLNELPTNDTRRVPFFQTAIRNLAWDLQAPEQLATLTPSERSIARGVIKDMEIPDERRARLLQALND